MPAVPPDEIPDRMRAAGHAAREVLLEVGAAVRAGVTTDELDRICHEAYIARGGYPSTLDYKGYPKSLCTSVNEVICHGIPDDRALHDGDIVNCDVTIYLHGVHGDCSATFLVGDVDDVGRRLVQVTYESLWKGIDAVRPGAPHQRDRARDPDSTSSRTGSASCARSSATASARRSTPRRRCRTSTTRTPTR